MRLVLGVLVSVLLLGSVASARSKGEKKAAAPVERKLKVKKLAPAKCERDGKKAECTMATKYVADAFALIAAKRLTDSPIACSVAGKPKDLNVKLLFDPAEAKVIIDENEKALAKLPACVVEAFVPFASMLYVELVEVLHDTDPRAELRTSLKVTLKLE